MTTAESFAARQAAAGIQQIEGYLLWQAETRKVRARAREFTDRLPWLTTAQRDEVECVYTHDQLGQARTALLEAADRCRELRGEYQDVYATLRRRLTVAFVVAGCVMTAVATAVLLGSR